ncbi:hypothetical protein ACHAWF_008270 [Thalassiosira exigua]
MIVPDKEAIHAVETTLADDERRPSPSTMSSPATTTKRWGKWASGQVGKWASGQVGKWRDGQFDSVLDLFWDDFAEKGGEGGLLSEEVGEGNVLLAGVHRRGEGGRLVRAAGVQHGQSLRAGRQVVKTYYTKPECPNGVAVEELKQWGGRKKLKEKIPIYAEKMLKEHDLMEEYKDIVDRVVAEGVSNKLKSWKIQKLKILMDEYRVSAEREGAMYERLDEATSQLLVTEDEMSALLPWNEADATEQLQASENLDSRTKD